jgi:hypothetical protein
MRIFLVALAVMAATLCACSGWDERAERKVCEKAHPNDKAKADECYRLNKLMYDKDVGNPVADAKR